MVPSRGAVGAIERVRQAWPEGVETIHEIHARFDAIGPQYVLGISLRDSFGRKDTMRRNFEFQPRRTSVAAILGVTGVPSVLSFRLN